MLRWLQVLLVFCLLGHGLAIAQDGATLLKPWAERLVDAGVIEPVLSKIHSNDPRDGVSSQAQVLRDVDTFLLNGSLSDAPIYKFQSPLFAEYKSRWRSMQANGKLPEVFCENFGEYLEYFKLSTMVDDFTAAVNARASQFGAQDLAATRIILAQMANSSDRSEAEIAHGGFASNQYFSLVETVDGLERIAGEIDAESSLAELPLSRMTTNLASLVEDGQRSAELHTALEKMCATGWLHVKNERGNNVEEELKAEMEKVREEFPELQLWHDTDSALYDENGDWKPQLTHSMTTYGAIYRDKLPQLRQTREDWGDYDEEGQELVVRPKTLDRYADICENVLNEDRWPASDQLRHLVSITGDDVNFIEDLGVYDFLLDGTYSDIWFRNSNRTVLVIYNSVVARSSLARSHLQGLTVIGSVFCRSLTANNTHFGSAPEIKWSVFFGGLNFNSANLAKGVDIDHSFIGLGEGGLHMGQAHSGGTIDLNDVYIAGGFGLGNARGDVLRLENVRIEQDLNFWGAQFSGPVFFGYFDKEEEVRGITVGGALGGTYFQGTDVRVENAFVVGSISFNQSIISNSLVMRKRFQVLSDW